MKIWLQGIVFVIIEHLYFKRLQIVFESTAHLDWRCSKNIKWIENGDYKVSAWYFQSKRQFHYWKLFLLNIPVADADRIRCRDNEITDFMARRLALYSLVLSIHEPSPVLLLINTIFFPKIIGIWSLVKNCHLFKVKVEIIPFQGCLVVIKSFALTYKGLTYIFPRTIFLSKNFIKI